MVQIEINDPKFAKPITYYMEDKMAKKLEEKVRIAVMKKDKDYLICIDGEEGSGKSTLAFQIGKKIDPSLNLSRVVFTAEEFKQAIFKAKKGQCIIFDEAFTGLSSRASLSGINRYLVSLMMQMRQKNLFVIIVLPTIFLLDKYVALWRTKVLIHVYESRTNIRGYFKVYGRKAKKRLFLEGRPTYSYLPKKIKPRIRGRFYGVFALGDEKEEENYKKKKLKSLEDTEKNPMSAGQVKYMEQRDLMMFLFRKATKMKYKEMVNYFNDYDLSMSLMQISRICAKFGDFGKEEDLNEDKSIENDLKEAKSDENEDKKAKKTSKGAKMVKNDEKEAKSDENE